MLTRPMSRGELKALIQGKITVYDDFEKMPCGYYKVTLNGKHGLLNYQYRQVLQPIYSSIDIVKRGVIIASRGKGNYEIFSEWGNPITKRVFTLKDDALHYASYF